MLRILLTFFAIIISNLAYCQQFEFKYFNTSNGLASDYIFHVTQNKQGYIWIATDKGVNRFNGSHFDHILDSVMVYRVSETKSGKIWMCTYEHGAILVDSISLKVKQVLIPQLCKSVYDIKEDDFGRLIIRTFSGLELIENGKSTLFKDSINQTPNNLLIPVNSNKFLFRINGKLNIVELSKSGFWVKPLASDNKNSKLFEGNTSIYFVGDKFQLSHEKSQGRILTKDFFNSLTINDSTYSAKELIYIQNATSFCNWNNIITVGTNNNGLVFIKNNSLEPINAKNGLRNNYVTSVFSDSFNQLWVGTFGGGVHKIIRTNYQILHDLTGIVNTVNTDSAGVIYAGTPEGLHIKLSENHLFKANEPEYRRNIRTITIDSNGKLYAGTFLALIGPSKPLSYFSGSAKVFMHGNGVSGIIPNADGTVWISTYGSGIWLVDSTNNVKKTIDNLPTLMINKLFRTSDAIWGTSDKGLILIKEGNSRTFTAKDGLIENYSSYVYEDNDKTIWIGNSKGINCYNPTNNSITSFINDFKGSNVIKIFRDKKGQLLVLSNTHLHLVSKGKLIPLNSFPITPNANYTLSEATYNARFNQLILATSNGIIILNLDNFQQVRSIPKLYVSNLLSDTLYLTPSNKQLILNPSHNKLYIKVGIHYLSDIQNVSWRYKFEGVDEEWSEPTTNFELNYPQLPYGTIKLLAKSINPDGIESEPQLLLTVFIKTPLYLRWYSLIVESVLLLLIIVFWVKYFALRKIKKRMRELEIQQKIHAERQRIARDLHDNVGSQLTYLITNLDQLSNEGNTKAGELSSFGKNAIGQLRETIWAIHSDFTDIEDFVDGIRKMCYQYLKGCNIDHNVEMQLSQHIKLTPIQTLNLYRIAQESITNIIKHSKATKVRIQISVDSSFTMMISDNGIGIINSMNGGYGVNNMKKRATEIDANITFSKNNEAGTTIQVNFLIAKN